MRCKRPAFLSLKLFFWGSCGGHEAKQSAVTPFISRGYGVLAIIRTRSLKAWLKQFCLSDMVRIVLIICILHRIWTIRFFVANMLPRQNHYVSAGLPYRSLTNANLSKHIHKKCISFAYRIVICRDRSNDTHKNYVLCSCVLCAVTCTFRGNDNLSLF